MDTARSRKDEVLRRLQEIESSLDEKRGERDKLGEIVKSLSPQEEGLQTAYEELRKKLEEVRTELRKAKTVIHDINSDGRELNYEKAQLERELSRIADIERINAEYLAQVEAFREKTLAAIWRKENRDDGLGAFTHQIEGGIHLAVAKQALLGDKRGLGKTLTALIYLDLLEARKVVIICPNDLMGNMEREIQFWAPHRSVFKLGKMGKGQRDFMLPVLKTLPEFVVILGYSSWRRDPQLIEDVIALRADSLLLDEAHHGKTADTLTARGIRDIRFGINRCPECLDEPQWFSEMVQYDADSPVYATCVRCGHNGLITDFSTIQNVLPMTGTAIMNRPQELFPQLHLIDPKNFQTESDFLDDFCRQGSGRHWTWSYQGESKLVSKIGPRYLARSREDTDVIIPPTTPMEHIITMDEMRESHPNQWKAYEQGRQWGKIVLNPEKETVLSMPEWITVILRLRQILVWPAAIELKVKDAKTGEVSVLDHLDVEESIKLDKAEELIKEFVDEKERTVLFSMFKPGLHVLQQRLLDQGIRVAIYDGSTTDRQKTAIELDFDPKHASKENYQWDVVLCNYKSAGEGLNLNAATQLILLDRYWNPAGEDQAAGRINRIGSTRDSMIHKIMVEQTVDTWMAALIQEKADLVHGFESQASKAYKALLDGTL